MEHAVHENIMRQARTRGSSSSSKKHPPIHWTENNNHILDDSSRNKYDEPIVATEPICELSDSYDSELHQPSFSDISSFFEEEQHQQRDCKRVKLEDVQSSKGEELNDDDFDEDAASETEEEQRPDPSVFTIEVLDDEDEDVQKSKEKPTIIKTEEEQMKPATLQDLPFKYISMDAATNTEPNGQDIQDDADRMFLLSLMPFLQRLDERRKLRVRQKLQNVLIEELEFGWLC